MSDHIPYEMQEEIIKWLPVKSLIQFRSVSKTWRSLIDSAPFIAAHSVRRPRSHHLFVRYTEPNHIDDVYLSIVDDDTFPQNKFSLTVPASIDPLKDLTMFGNCHGLFCMYGFYEDGDELDDPFQRMAVLWNPSIRKTVAIFLPNEPITHGLIFGFGVCPVTSDTKILMFGSKNPEQVKIFKLSSGTWRSSTLILPGELPNFDGCKQVVVGKFIHWLVSLSIAKDDGGLEKRNAVLSFDLTSDKFEAVYLPTCLILEPATELSIFKRKESLAIVKFSFNVNLQGYTVWKMKHCVSDTIAFMKLYTLTENDTSVHALLGFRKSGEHLLEVQDDEDKDLDLVALADYKTYSKHYYYYDDIYGSESSFCVYSYKESLLLHNQPDIISCVALDEDEDAVTSNGWSYD